MSTAIEHSYQVHTSTIDRKRHYRFECSCAAHRGAPGSNFGIGPWVDNPNGARSGGVDHHRKYHR